MNAIEVADGEGARTKAALARFHGEMDLRGHALALL